MSLDNTTEDDNVVDLKLIQGGKQPPDNDWLRKLSAGTSFVCGYIGKDLQIDRWRGFEWVLDERSANVAHVTMIKYEGTRPIACPTWVIIDKFYKEWELAEITHDGKGDRSDQRERLEQLEDIQTDSRMDEIPGQKTVATDD